MILPSGKLESGKAHGRRRTADRPIHKTFPHTGVLGMNTTVSPVVVVFRALVVGTVDLKIEENRRRCAAGFDQSQPERKRITSGTMHRTTVRGGPVRLSSLVFDCRRRGKVRVVVFQWFADIVLVRWWLEKFKERVEGKGGAAVGSSPEGRKGGGEASGGKEAVVDEGEEDGGEGEGSG
ncbi:hypothetical protein HAX54_041287 [Datura stramonium]|uniref:Uncharacterized protein n=1 Tax=Datura stramonium TaxID=4076 RepID=A0ABS8VQB6_DATST|nr:hypothetical protein [Datura stramonium]